MPEKCIFTDHYVTYDSSEHDGYRYTDAIYDDRDRNHDNCINDDAIDECDLYEDFVIDNDAVDDCDLHDDDAAAVDNDRIHDNYLYVFSYEHHCNHDSLWASFFGSDAFQERTEPCLCG